MTQPTPPKSAPLLHMGHPDAHIPMFEAPAAPGKKMSHAKIIILLILAAGGALLGWALEHFAHNGNVTPDVTPLAIIPFGVLLLCIAVMPFIARHFWEHNYPYISIALGLIVVIYYCFAVSAPELAAPRAIAKSFAEYISFICLLGSLFIVSGGILIRVRRRATPLANTTLLLIGALISNIFGTTGASMLLIRPFLRINKGHIRPYHVVFFIFSVSNLGGALTPIGDPPLFLGYLKGVPFWWVAQNCWPMWAVAVGAILAVFFVFDTIHHAKQPRAHHDAGDLGPAVSIFGAANLIFIALIIIAVFLPQPYRELQMVAAACLSLWITPHRIHVENVFNFAPIKEVALLFVGIFATMVPALNYLSTHANDPALSKYLKTPGQFYFSCGTLSSVLDNAPTYMTFLETELGKINPKLKEVAKEVVYDKTRSTANEADLLKKDPARYADRKLLEDDLREVNTALTALRKFHGDKVQNGSLTKHEIEIGFLLGDETLNWYIVAISLGAVFFGAMTYIGNGPNFMVKSIAENAGVECPSFFNYIFRYSLPILLPILILIWLIFLMSHTGH